METSKVDLFIEDYIRNSCMVSRGVIDECGSDIKAAASLITESFKSGGKLLICGNGGSAADAQHLAAEFVPLQLPAIALTTDTSFLTAWSNDHSFASVFSQQVSALGKPGDVLLGISTSGKSGNVIQAFYRADFMGLRSIALTGKIGLGVVADTFPTVTIKVPSTDTQHIQECHLIIYHIIWLLVKQEMDAD